MTNAEYLETQNRLIAAARELAALNLQSFRDRIHTAHAVGPVIDPTTYRAGAETMQAIGDLAYAAQKVVRALGCLDETVVLRAVAEVTR